MAWGEPMIAQFMEHYCRVELLRKAWASYRAWNGLGWPEEKAKPEPPPKEAE